MRKEAFFSSRMAKELKKLVATASDLPAEILRLLPALETGLYPMSVIRRSANGSWTHYKIRIRSKLQAVGKREGYRAHAVIGPSEMRFFCIYIAHGKQDNINPKDRKAIALAIESETVSELSGEWFTLDDFVEKFLS